MRRLAVLFMVVVTLYAQSMSVLANGGPANSFSACVGGNIVFEHTPDITVEAEDLNINLSLIVPSTKGSCSTSTDK